MIGKNDVRANREFGPPFVATLCGKARVPVCVGQARRHGWPTKGLEHVGIGLFLLTSARPRGTLSDNAAKGLSLPLGLIAVQISIQTA